MFCAQLEHAVIERAGYQGEESMAGLSCRLATL